MAKKNGQMSQDNEKDQADDEEMTSNTTSDNVGLTTLHCFLYKFITVAFISNSSFVTLKSVNKGQ